MINLKKNTEISFDKDVVTQPDNICDGCGYHKASCTCKYTKFTDPTNVSNQFDGLGIKTDSKGFLIV